MQGISLGGLVLFAWKEGFYVSGEGGVPAGGAGEYPEVLLGGEDYRFCSKFEVPQGIHVDSHEEFEEKLKGQELENN